MRIRELNLIRYGKFTDRSLSLPWAEQDIHLIVGPNEAGKSTVRNAIAEWLFGMPVRTTLDFLHPMPSLRIGGVLERLPRRETDGRVDDVSRTDESPVRGSEWPERPQAVQQQGSGDTAGRLLAFERTKGQKNTLRTPADEVLPADVLQTWLGNLQLDAFNRMYALDHDMLIKGGDGILSASDDIGRMLFQSAAGLEHLGEVLSALKKDADSLWGIRKANTRLYYRAHDAYSAAKADFSQAQLRSKDWKKRYDELTKTEDELIAARKRHEDTRRQQSRLERIRRIQPLLLAHDEARKRLDRLASDGMPVLLDEHAAAVFRNAAEKRARIDNDIEHLQQEIAEIETDLKKTPVDREVLARAADIKALNEKRLQFSDHASNLLKRREELRGLSLQLRSRAENLGWDGLDAADMRQRLPAASLRAQLLTLIRERTDLLQALQFARSERNTAQRLIEQTRRALQEIGSHTVDTGLQVAVDQAMRLGDHEALMADERRSLDSLAQQIESALAGLGSWRQSAERLRAMVVPEASTVQRLIDQQRQDAAELKAQQEALNAKIHDIDVLEQGLQQLVRNWQPVSLEQLQQARRARDDSWRAIKSTRFGAREPSASQASSGSTKASARVTAAPSSRGFPQTLSLFEPVADTPIDPSNQASNPETSAPWALNPDALNQGVSNQGTVNPASCDSGSFVEMVAGFERQMHVADELADARLERAQHEAERQAGTERLGQYRIERTSIEQRLQAVQNRIEANARHWCQLTDDCGLPKLPLDVTPTWLQQRERALQLLDRHATLARQHQQRGARAEQCRQALWAALGRQSLDPDRDLDRDPHPDPDRGSDPDPNPNPNPSPNPNPDPNPSPNPAPNPEPNQTFPTLAECLRRASALIARDQQAQGRRATLMQQLHQSEQQLIERDAALETVRQEEERWQRAWHALLVQIDYPADTPVERLEAHLSIFKEVDDLLTQMVRIQRDEIDCRQTDLDGLASTARALAEALEPDRVGQSADEIALALIDRLEQACEAQTAEAALRDRLARAVQARDVAVRELSGVQASMAPLLAAAGVETWAALGPAIERSDQRRAIEHQLQASESELIRNADGLPIAALREEAKGMNPDVLKAELDARRIEIDGIVEEISRLSGSLGQQKTEFEKLDGRDAAARAAARQQEAVADMADAAERYLRLHTAARLLEWSIARFRETRQGPMLAKASGIFGELTMGSFSRLLVDSEDDSPRLYGVRPGGQWVEVGGMSEGTRDQLYLALRLAAFELQIEQGQPMPLIADDLFINFDDRRTAAGLRVLGGLSRKTQIICLTHHDHLVPLASEVLGSCLNVIEL
ncbi:MAG: AAA family ATPase [Lautropia sp.]|nr:AAA family ATPase [Lautropia sp.]